MAPTFLVDFVVTALVYYTWEKDVILPTLRSTPYIDQLNLIFQLRQILHLARQRQRHNLHITAPSDRELAARSQHRRDLQEFIQRHRFQPDLSPGWTVPSRVASRGTPPRGRRVRHRAITTRRTTGQSSTLGARSARPTHTPPPNHEGHDEHVSTRQVTSQPPDQARLQ